MTADFVTDRRTGHGRRKTDVRVTPDLIVQAVTDRLSPLFEHPDPDVRVAVADACVAVGWLIR